MIFASLCLHLSLQSGHKLSILLDTPGVPHHSPIGLKGALSHPSGALWPNHRAWQVTFGIYRADPRDGGLDEEDGDFVEDHMNEHKGTVPVLRREVRQ